MKSNSQRATTGDDGLHRSHHDNPAANHSSKVKITSSIANLCGWPTKTCNLDFGSFTKPHTLIVFIPGNPGLLEWYIRSLKEILLRIGPGYAVRAVANAGHAVESQLVRPRNTHNTEAAIAWTMKGQIQHKAKYLESLMADFPTQDFVFISHSIGAYFTQQLCVMRPDILRRTKLILHLTPFLRMSAPWPKQTIFDSVAARPQSTIRAHEPLMRLLKSLPISLVDGMLTAAIQDQVSREVTLALLRQPLFCENFFQLGLCEIREVPREFDVSYGASHNQVVHCVLTVRALQLATFRILDKSSCRTAILVAGNDHWCPLSQAQELQSLVRCGTLRNMKVAYDPAVKHAYVLYPNTSEQRVVQFCVDEIHRLDKPRSRL